MTNGYVYFAYGKKRFMNQAQRSAKSLLKHDKEANITVFTDIEGHFPPFPIDKTVYFPALRPQTQEEGKLDNCYEGKMLNLWRTPYDRTMIVDTDTFFLGDPSGVFEMLDYFDFALTQSNSYLTIKGMEPPYNRVEGLVPYNSGIMLFRKSPAARMVLMEDLKKLWLARRSIHKTHRMDIYLTLALAASQATVGVLPPIFNARINSPLTLDGEVKVLHYAGRIDVPKDSLECIGQDINVTTGKRIWIPEVGKCWSF